MRQDAGVGQLSVGDCCYGRLGTGLSSCCKSRCCFISSTGSAGSRKSSVKWSSQFNKSANPWHGFRHDRDIAVVQTIIRHANSTLVNRCSSWSRGHIQRLDPPCTCNLAHIRRQGHVQSHVVSQLFLCCYSSVRRCYNVLPLPMTSVNALCRFWIFYRAYHDGDAFLVRTHPTSSFVRMACTTRMLPIDGCSAAVWPRTAF